MVKMVELNHKLIGIQQALADPVKFSETSALFNDFERLASEGHQDAQYFVNAFNQVYMAITRKPA